MAEVNIEELRNIYLNTFNTAYYANGEYSNSNATEAGIRAVLAAAGLPYVEPFNDGDVVGEFEIKQTVTIRKYHLDPPYDIVEDYPEGVKYDWQIDATGAESDNYYGSIDEARDGAANGY